MLIEIPQTASLRAKRGNLSIFCVGRNPFLHDSRSCQERIPDSGGLCCWIPIFGLLARYDIIQGFSTCPFIGMTALRAVLGVCARQILRDSGGLSTSARMHAFGNAQTISPVQMQYTIGIDR